ncbi:hypothetical protein BC831DRAFT_478698, partial [Entophlyctis helioformis]
MFCGWYCGICTGAPRGTAPLMLLLLPLPPLLLRGDALPTGMTVSGESTVEPAGDCLAFVLRDLLTTKKAPPAMTTRPPTTPPMMAEVLEPLLLPLSVGEGPPVAVGGTDGTGDTGETG